MAICPVILPTGIAGDKHYKHIQNTASNEWVIEHRLGKSPAIRCQNSSGTTIKGRPIDVEDNGIINRTRVIFSIPTSGQAYCN